jgi:2-succinyl-6-hydroxy-2,4-cyclohexadiene-1-carboxylate synthase
MTAALGARVTGSGPSLVLAHGFTQTGRVWGTMDGLLANGHRVVAPDMPGHADSTAVTASLAEGADLIGELGGRASYLGYSMGARFCLHLALSRPDLVEALVLISGTAGIDDPDERLERRRSDAAIPVETFLRQWMESPMFSGISPEAAGMEERMRNTGPGLASSLRLAGTGTQVPLWSELDQLTMPVLVITGERDAKFTGLGRRLVDAIGPNSTLVVVAGTGHAPHLERPAEVTAAVRTHLSRVRPE